jgi:hypothetical protein
MHLTYKIEPKGYKPVKQRYNRQWNWNWNINRLLAGWQWLTPVILTAWEDERTDHSSRTAQAKMFVRLHLNRKKLVMVAHACHPSNGGKLKIGKLWSRLSGQGKKWDPISKITRAKGDGKWLVAQETEGWPCKCEALRSIPNTTKKKKQIISQSLKKN